MRTQLRKGFLRNVSTNLDFYGFIYGSFSGDGGQATNASFFVPYDLTFDTILRLQQAASFQENMTSTASEQVENKFQYEAKTTGGFVNTGAYILFYDNDLTIKTAQ